MNKLLLLCLMAPSLVAMKKPNKTAAPNVEISQQEFQQCKQMLPSSLNGFVEDFATWTKEDKEKIEIFGLNFAINNLDKKKAAPYEGNVGYWVDCRTQTQKQRVCLINCLKYLQNNK